MRAKCYFSSFMLTKLGRQLMRGQGDTRVMNYDMEEQLRHSLGVYLQGFAFSWCRRLLAHLPIDYVNTWKHANARFNVDAIQTWSTFVGTHRCHRSRWNQMGPWLCHCSWSTPHNPLCFKSRHLFNPCFWWCQYSLNIQFQIVREDLQASASIGNRFKLKKMYRKDRKIYVILTKRQKQIKKGLC